MIKVTSTRPAARCLLGPSFLSLGSPWEPGSSEPDYTERHMVSRERYPCERIRREVAASSRRLIFVNEKGTNGALADAPRFALPSDPRGFDHFGPLTSPRAAPPGQRGFLRKPPTYIGQPNSVTQSLVRLWTSNTNSNDPGGKQKIQSLRCRIDS